MICKKKAIADINAPLFSWVLENLVSNALNAIKEQQGYVKIIIDQDHDLALIDVQDSGSGITKSQFNNVFKPGYTTRKRGWGLGLSLSKRIIESYHSGKIFIKESQLGKGTRFRIELKPS
jgi:signal transduction histidine kinase